MTSNYGPVFDTHIWSVPSNTILYLVWVYLPHYKLQMFANFLLNISTTTPQLNEEKRMRQRFLLFHSSLFLCLTTRLCVCVCYTRVSCVLLYTTIPYYAPQYFTTQHFIKLENTPLLWCSILMSCGQQPPPTVLLELWNSAPASTLPRPLSLKYRCVKI